MGLFQNPEFMKVLFLSRWFPYPVNNGARLRIFNLLKGLASQYEVTLVSFIDSDQQETLDSPLHAICKDIYTVPWRPFNPSSVVAKLGFLSPKPRSVLDTFSEKLDDLVKKMVSSGEYQIVVASELGMAEYIQSNSATPSIIEEIELGVFYQQFAGENNILSKLRAAMTWYKQAQYTRSLLKKANGCTVVSYQEKDLLAIVSPGYQNVAVIPNCITLESYSDIQCLPQPNSLIFTGSFSFQPNYEAMCWFLKDVFPKVIDAIPDARITITGDTQNKDIPFKKNVTLAGYVNDIRQLVSSSWISLAPIWSGGGTRLKILEAMAMRTPVIATSKGAEGIEVENGKHILIADTVDQFTEAVIGLLRNPQLRQDLATNAYDLVAQKYDWGVVMPQFLDLIKTTRQSYHSAGK